MEFICGSHAYTLDGMMAKARAAKAEARMRDGREEPTASVAGDWAWEILNDLLAGGTVA